MTFLIYNLVLKDKLQIQILAQKCYNLYTYYLYLNLFNHVCLNWPFKFILTVSTNH